MSSELLCKDCKHGFRKFYEFPIWGSGVEWRCKKGFVNAEIEQDPVRGAVKREAHYQRCSTMRFRTNEICGLSGKLWEPKNKKFFFLAIKHSQR
jgi:hypothetical protein